MNEPLISVIVPVYKVEKYLRKCVDSIINQTYTNLEIILVDDGSPDGCPAICDEYASKDSRVRVIHQQNGGLSAARNAGTQIASGKYICFVDSDDYIDRDSIMSMLTSGYEADVISCSLINETESGKEVSRRVTTNRVYSSSEAVAEMCYEKKLGTSACGKIVLREIVLSNLFPVGRLYEDLFTVYKWLDASRMTVTVSSTFYHYVHRFGSISFCKWNDNTTDLMEAAESLLSFISVEYSENYNAALYRYFLSAHDFLMKAQRSRNYRRIFKPYQTRLKNMWRPFLNGNDLSPKEIVKFGLMTFCPPLYKLVFKIRSRFILVK